MQFGIGMEDQRPALPADVQHDVLRMWTVGVGVPMARNQPRRFRTGDWAGFSHRSPSRLAHPFGPDGVSNPSWGVPRYGNVDWYRFLPGVSPWVMAEHASSGL